MSNFLSFISGSIFGMYLAQNYDLPNIKKTSDILYKYIKALEKNEKKDKDD